ncbi:MAG TPA: metal ABC transporter permease [Burkholderiaceae bacterium]|nr:metal ABC transporter permease [Burkholderiaceae bacterium]
MIELLLWPFLAGLVLVGMHAWLGLHVLARGVVFVDLALAQLAALGLTVAVIAGHAVQSDAGYAYALAFAALGALLFAVARRHEAAMPQEAVIGIVYAVSAALGVIALDRAPQGAEHIKQLLIGSLLTITPQEVASLAALYGAIGLLHVVMRRPLVHASFGAPEGGPSRPAGGWLVWDLMFYGSFALVVTSSVRLAGVLPVFSYLIVPAAIAGLLARSLVARLILAWLVGVVAHAAGLLASWQWDLPTGPAVVAAFGAATAAVALAFAVVRAGRALRAHGIAALAPAGLVLAALVAGAGLLLAAFPGVDQPWLDALERLAPSVQRAFLRDDERDTRERTLRAIAEADAELVRLHVLEQDARWGKVTMDAERRERLRQYLAGRAEIAAGDRMVMQALRASVRQRQRFLLGLPMMVVGTAVAAVLVRRRRAGEANGDVLGRNVGPR